MNVVSGAPQTSGAAGMSMGTSSSNVRDTVFNIMKQMAKNNKFIHKQDIWTYIQKQTDYATFDKTLNRLVEDG